MLTNDERATISLFASTRYNAVALTEYVIALKQAKPPRTADPEHPTATETKT